MHGGVAIIEDGPDTANPEIWSVTRDASDPNFYVDGSAQAMTGSGPGTPSGSTHIAGHGAGEYLNDTMTFAAIMGAAASAADHNVIGGELADLYGIAWNEVN